MPWHSFLAKNISRVQQSLYAHNVEFSPHITALIYYQYYRQTKSVLLLIESMNACEFRSKMLFKNEQHEATNQATFFRCACRKYEIRSIGGVDRHRNRLLCLESYPLTPILVHSTIVSLHLRNKKLLQYVAHNAKVLQVEKVEPNSELVVCRESTRR